MKDKDFDRLLGEVPNEELPDYLKQSPPPPLDEPHGQTDLANAERFLHLHREQVAYVGTWERWLVFDGQRWRLDDMRLIQGLAKGVSRMLFDQLNADSEKSEFSFAKKSGNAYALKCMLEMAENEVAIHHTRLDTHPWLLNVQNGTIDLKSGKLRTHDRDDFLTAISPAVYNADARCPTWLSFLERIFDGDESLIGFMQRLFGYTLTGAIAEHILPVLFGTGANGKSTLLGVLMELLGEDYACKCNDDLISGRKSEHKTQFADLFGKRFAYSEETGEGQRLAETQVKFLTGGGAIRARRMREDFWQFMPTHKLFLATNHKPEIVGTDHGIWRRVKLIPFGVVIPDSEQDLELPKKLKHELSGILNWSIEGCMAWQQNGLQEPDGVTAATDEYRREQDVLGQFIEEHCTLGESLMVQASSLYQAYRDAGGNATQTRFGLAITERGFRKERPNHGPNRKKTVYRGIGLISEED